MVTIRPATWLDSMNITVMWAKLHLEINTREAMLKENSDAQIMFYKIIERLKDENWMIFIAEQDSQIIGFIMGKVHWPMYSQCHIMGTCEVLYIYPEHRGNGVYKNLIETLESAAREKGAKEIEFICLNDERLLRFYDKLGYEPVQVVLRQKELKIQKGVII